MKSQQANVSVHFKGAQLKNFGSEKVYEISCLFDFIKYLNE